MRVGKIGTNLIKKNLFKSFLMLNMKVGKNDDQFGVYMQKL